VGERRAVRTICRLELATIEAGGLSQPLLLPTPSLVFKLGPEAADSGLVAFIVRTEPSVDALTAGLTANATVEFLAEPDTYVGTGRRYWLWMGRTVGEAVVTEVLD
jgi:hypothetical protein